jgi:hypothetical protein
VTRAVTQGWSIPRAAAELGVSARTFVRSWRDELVERGAAWPAGDGTRRAQLRFDPAAVLALRDERRIRVPVLAKAGRVA